ALSLRSRRVQVLRRPAAAAREGTQGARLPAPRRDRERMDEGARVAPVLPAHAGWSSGRLSQTRPDEADAAPAALRARRLPLPAPGRLRRRHVSAAAHVRPEPA